MTTSFLYINKEKIACWLSFKLHEDIFVFWNSKAFKCDVRSKFIKEGKEMFQRTFPRRLKYLLYLYSTEDKYILCSVIFNMKHNLIQKCLLNSWLWAKYCVGPCDKRVSCGHIPFQCMLAASHSQSATLLRASLAMGQAQEARRAGWKNQGVDALGNSPSHWQIGAFLPLRWDNPWMYSIPSPRYPAGLPSVTQSAWCSLTYPTLTF